MGDFSYTFGVAAGEGPGHYTTFTYNTEHGLDPAYSALHNASITTWISESGTRGSRTWSRWRECVKCSLEFPESEMVEYNGTWYCREDFEGVEEQDLEVEYENWEEDSD